jgi:hypothetical protein
MSQFGSMPFTRKQLTIIFKIAFLEAMALSIILPSVTSTGEISSSGNPHDTVPLGTWQNFPSGTCCKDGNELMFNHTHRGLFRILSDGKYTVGFEVQCITPSNHAGATLQLQFANESATTMTNTTNFKNAGTTNLIKIDNSANNPCPGTLSSSVTAFTLPQIASPIVQILFIFRVVGFGGGGAGDNPRFGSINVIISTQLFDQFVGYSSSTTTTDSMITIGTDFPVITATTVTYDYVATDGVTFQGGTNTCVIPHGQSACTVDQFFPVAFAGTPAVTVTSETNVGADIVFAGNIPLLNVQTTTV